MENLVLKYLQEIKHELKHFDGCCRELVFGTHYWLLREKMITHYILRIEPKDERLTIVAHYPPNIRFHWGYHFAIIFDGLVHDGWLSNPLPKDQYFELVFPNQDVVADSFYGASLKVKESSQEYIQGVACQKVAQAEVA